MRAPRLLLLCLGLCGGVRFAPAGAGGATARWAAPSCRARCASRESAPKSQACPAARYFNGIYMNWRTHRPCGAEKLSVEVECDGLAGTDLARLIREQLGGKRVVMVGDSMMRQNYIGLLCLLWEEGLVNGSTKNLQLENSRNAGARFDSMNSSYPELGAGTQFSFVRLNWGQASPFLKELLDSADVTVANLGLHYRPEGITSHAFFDNSLYSSTYAEDAQALMQEVASRGRPGHRAFWSQTYPCAERSIPKSLWGAAYGCGSKRNHTQVELNQIAAAQPGYGGLRVIPTEDLLSEFWWAHPGSADCCHRTGMVPGLLSSFARVLVASLAPDAEGAAAQAQVQAGALPGGTCPSFEGECEVAAGR